MQISKVSFKGSYLCQTSKAASELMAQLAKRAKSPAPGQYGNVVALSDAAWLKNPEYLGQILCTDKTEASELTRIMHALREKSPKIFAEAREALANLINNSQRI